jgi:hypothetical protein
MQKRQEVLKRLAARSLRTNGPIAPPKIPRLVTQSSARLVEFLSSRSGGVLSFSEIVMNIRRVNVCSSEPLCCLRGILARHRESDDVQVATFRFASEPRLPRGGGKLWSRIRGSAGLPVRTYLNRCYLSRCGISAARTSPRSSCQYRKCRVARGLFLGVCWPWLSKPDH